MNEKEPIMIDDVDVAECEHRCDTHKELLADGHIKEFIHYCQITNTGCYGYICYYKQLKRLENEYEGFAVKYTDMEIALKRKEEECEFLKNITTLQSRDMHDKKLQLDQLKAENDELKKTIDDLLHKPEIQNKILWKVDNEALLGSKDAWIYKLEQSLQEIREFAENEMEQDVNTSIILQKCEVIDDNDNNSSV